MQKLRQCLNFVNIHLRLLGWIECRRYRTDVGFTPEVVNIDEMSNVGIPGVFVFRIDDSEVLQPCQEGCKNSFCNL